MEDTTKYVLDTIRKERNLRRLSQQEMAQRLGITQDMYSRLERGETQLTLNRLVLIQRILPFSVDNILHEYYDLMKLSYKQIQER